MNQEYKKLRKKILEGDSLSEKEISFYQAHIQVFGLNLKSLEVHNKFLEIQEKQELKRKFPILNLKFQIKENEN